MNPTSHRTTAVLLLLALVAKLLVVARLDMPAIGGSNDDFWCVQSSLCWFWHPSTYTQDTLIKEPGWPLFMALIAKTGVPLRIAYEVMLWATGVGVAYLSSAYQPRARRSVFWWSFCLIFFCPLSLQVFERSTYDAFAGMLMVLSLVALFPLCQAGGARTAIRSCAVLGLVTGAMSITRGEASLMIGSSLGAVVLITACVRELTWWPRAVLLAKRLAATLLAVAAVQLPVRCMNLAIFGGFFISEQTESSFTLATQRLAEIDAGTVLPGTSITMAALELAAQCSPAAAELLPPLRGGIGASWSFPSLGRPHPAHEIGSGWILWAIRDAVAAAGHYGSSASARAYYARLASELDLAFAQGHLKKRSVIHPIIGPLPPLAEIARSAWSILACCLEPRQFAPLTEHWDPGVEAAYDRACNRRATFYEKEWGEVRVDGLAWDTKLPGPIVAVFFQGQNGLCCPGKVRAVFADDLPCKGGEIALSLDCPEAPGTLHLFDYHGHHLKLPMPLPAGGTKAVVDDWSVALSATEAIPGKRKSRVGIAALVWGWGWSIALCAGMLAAALAVARGWLAPSSTLAGFGGHPRLSAFVPFLAVSFIVAMRLAMMATVDASAFHMRDFRYLFPITLCLPVIGVALLLAAGKTWAGRPGPATAPDLGTTT